MSFADTTDDNFPLLLPKDLIGPAFAIIEKIDKNTTDIFLTESLNFHLGTKGLNISEISLEANKRGMNFSDTLAIIE